VSLATTETNKSVTKFINSIKDEQKRKDAKELLKIIQKITKKKPKIWGDNFMIGFGKYKYKRKGSKEELEWFNVGFAPRKNNITLYLTGYLEKEPLIKKLGKCKHGKGCLYINKLDDINLPVLKKLITKYKDGQWYSY
jgi:hypothetical protein